MNKLEGLLEELNDKDVVAEGRQLDLVKARQLTHSSNVANVLGSLSKAGLKGKYDVQGGSGYFVCKGYRVNFSAGEENFTFSFPKILYTKDAATETVRAIVNLLNTVSNYS